MEGLRSRSGGDVRRIIITAYHEVEDDVAEEFHESVRRMGSSDAILKFMQEHRPESIWFSSGGIKPRES